MKLLISSLLLVLLASVSLSAQTTAPEAAAPAQDHMAAPAGEATMARETKHKKSHKASSHHAKKKKHNKKKKHHSAPAN